MVCLEQDVQLIATVYVVSHIGNPGVAGHQCVLGSNVQVVIDLPVHVTHFPSWVEETLKNILQNL